MFVDRKQVEHVAKVGDREVVDAYIKLGVVQEKWLPGILRRYQAGMIDGHPKVKQIVSTVME